MRLAEHLILVLGSLALLAIPSYAATSALGGGRGGPFFEYHAGSLSSFDPSISGNPVVIGGVGYGFASKVFRIGGGGGGGFLWNANDNVNFGLGYGGAIGEYVIAPWLSGRLMIGGGGYSVSRVLSQTDSTTVVQKIDSGGFLLFYPSVLAEVNLSGWVNMAINVGYFLPNVSKLQSFTMGIHLIFGKG